MPYFFLSNICLFWDTVFLGILKNLFSSCLGILCLLMLEWMWNALFFVRHFSILGLSILWDIKKPFFSAVWAFHVYSCLSGCGMPYFFFGPTFFHFGTQYFWEYQKTLFSAVWAFHVYSCLSGCGMPYFFFWFDFFPFWNSVSLGILKTLFSAVSGISCLLMLEWMWNAIFFLV